MTKKSDPAGGIKEHPTMGYLVCSECGGYYKLKDGESPSDFIECECGGLLKYYDSLEEAYEGGSESVEADEPIQELSEKPPEYINGEPLEGVEKKLSLEDVIIEGNVIGDRREIIKGMIRDEKNAWDDMILEWNPNFVSMLKKQREEIKKRDQSKAHGYQPIIIVLIFIILFIIGLFMLNPWKI